MPVAYKDLLDPDYVFRALLGYGMFSEKLPPCFSSQGLLNYASSITTDKPSKNYAYIEYASTRNTNIPRMLAIPHPEPYLFLCKFIQKHWSKINNHIGEPQVKFNYCHVRRIAQKKHIFEMNYSGDDKWFQEELALDYSIGCKYIVSADISTFFPSVYVHSIPWAINGKEWAKIHQCNISKKNNEIGRDCRRNNKQPCIYDLDSLWGNSLDYLSRAFKDGETNGLLIGPHTSNIISEIILSNVDRELQNCGFSKVIRHIDDYEYYAKDEKDANDFLKKLTQLLKHFELSLNAKKTKIIPYQDYSSSNWITKLNQFSFPKHEIIGFTTINSYIDYSLVISKDMSDFSPLNYAIKVISKKKLSKRAKRLYVKKICQLVLFHPYIIPLVEEYVFKFADGDFSFLKTFLPISIDLALEKNITDLISFNLYFANKYDIELNGIDWNMVTELYDCISLIIAYKYCCKKQISTKIFKEKAESLRKLPEREQEKFWLFLYEISPKSKLPVFLKQLKEANITFTKGI